MIIIWLNKMNDMGNKILLFSKIYIILLLISIIIILLLINIKIILCFRYSISLYTFII